MKHCNRCQKDKDDSEFNKNSKKADGLQAYCRSCCKEKSAEYFQDNKQKFYEKRNKIRDIRREKVNKVKSESGCLVCGVDDVACLDFHHKGEKENNVATMVLNYTNMEKLEEEIDKCVVLCSNCHRKLHYYNYTLDELLNCSLV